MTSCAYQDRQNKREDDGVVFTRTEYQKRKRGKKKEIDLSVSCLKLIRELNIGNEKGRKTKIDRSACMFLFLFYQ